MAKRRIQSKNKWKSKVWYQLTAPGDFGEAVVGETPADDPQKVIGRMVSVPARELTGNSRQNNQSLLLKVTKVAGTTAKTDLAGYEVMRTYLRSIVRRRKEKLDLVQDVQTKDDVKIRVKSVIITANKAHDEQGRGLVRLLKETIEQEAKANELGAFIRKVMEMGPQQAVKEAARKLVPVTHVEIRKIEIL
ncbi:MAG TPA: 30S ribosomal protein S3ae [archaeon]|nr:30S ribosomal protein S3ae [archaeon]